MYNYIDCNKTLSRVTEGSGPMKSGNLLFQTGKVPIPAASAER